MPSDAAATAPSDARRTALAIVSASTGSVLYTLDANIAAVALPAIARDLGVASAGVVALVSVYNLVTAMALLPLAAVAQRIGLRRVFVVGLGGYLVAAALSFPAAQTLPTLIAARAVQALASAAVLSVSIAQVRSLYPPSKLGRGLGLNTVMSASGAALAPAVGGWIVAAASWPFVFAAGVPLAMLALATATALPKGETATEGVFDRMGAALSACVFGLFVSGFQGLAAGAARPAASLALVASVALAVVFVRHERRTAAPVLPVDLLELPALALSVAANLAAVLGSTVLMLSLPFRLTEAGLSPAAIGTMLVPFAIAAMVVAPAAGMASDRLSPTALGTAGLLLAAAGAAALAILPTNPGFGDVAWRVALCGAGYSLFYAPNGRLVVGSAPPGRAASAAGLLSTTRMLGQAMGAALTGLVLASSLAPAGPALAATALTLVAAVLSALRIVIGKTPASRETA